MSTGPDASPSEPAAPAATAPAAPAAEPDPWDEPADTTDHQPAKSAASAPVAEPEAERPSSDLLVDSGTPAAAAVDDSVDPWDEPADTTDHLPAKSAASAPVAEPEPEAERPSGDLLVDSGTLAAAPAAVDDSVDPWDEPADTTDPQPAESAASAPVPEPQPEGERPSGDLLVDSGTVGGDEVSEAAQEAPASDAVTTASPQAEQTEPKPAAEPKAAPTGFTGDAALLDEPDPWD